MTTRVNLDGADAYCVLDAGEIALGCLPWLFAAVHVCVCGVGGCKMLSTRAMSNACVQCPALCGVASRRAIWISARLYRVREYFETFVGLLTILKR